MTPVAVSSFRSTVRESERKSRSCSATIPPNQALLWRRPNPPMGAAPLLLSGPFRSPRVLDASLGDSPAQRAFLTARRFPSRGSSSGPMAALRDLLLVGRMAAMAAYRDLLLVGR